MTSDVYKMVLKLAELFKIQVLIDYCCDYEKGHKRKSGRPSVNHCTQVTTVNGNEPCVKTEVVMPKRGRGRGIKQGFKPSRGRGSVSGTSVVTTSSPKIEPTRSIGRGRKRGRGRGRGLSRPVVSNQRPNADISAFEQTKTKRVNSSALSGTKVEEIDNEQFFSETFITSRNSQYGRKGGRTRAEIQKAYRERKMARMTPEELLEHRRKEAERVRLRSKGASRGSGRGRLRGRGRKPFTPRIQLKEENSNRSNNFKQKPKTYKVDMFVLFWNSSK